VVRLRRLRRRRGSTPSTAPCSATADHAARTYSDIGLYTAVALPFALDLGDALLQRARDGSAARSRHMRGWAVDAVVLLETFAVTYAATNVVKFAVRRPRPYSYDA
jgi:hypothetical protein